MSAISVAATIIEAVYPPATPILSWAAPIAEALWNNREEIADALKAAKPAIEAIKEATPQVLPHLEAAAKSAMLQWPGKTKEEVVAAVATKAVKKAVGNILPGWNDEAATRWMDCQNATA